MTGFPDRSQPVLVATPDVSEMELEAIEEVRACRALADRLRTAFEG